MKAEEIINYALYSEFANLPFASMDTEEDKLKVFSYLDRALYEVNKEFSLNHSEEIIRLIPKQAKYFITSLGLLKVLTAYKSDGTELGVNEEENITSSIFTPALNLIEYYGEIDPNIENDFISVIFLERFDKVRSLTDNIRITETYLDCLLNYMAFLAHSSVSATNDSDAPEYMRRYLAAVETIKSQGINYISRYTNNQFISKGFI